MAHEKNHDYHVLPPSIWPFLGALSGFVMLLGAVFWMNGMGPWLFLIGFAGVLYVMFAWWADIVAEAEGGEHTPVVRLGLRYGFLLFVISEVMFFAAWFWSFFKHTMYPMYEYAGTEYVQPEFYQVSAFDLPLINTLVLLCSGAAVTWAHHALAHGGTRKDVEHGLLIGVLLGIAFLGLQSYEYYYLIAVQDWSFSGEIFFANFFMATGFHGVHVFIGVVFLTVCYFRTRAGHFTADKHVGFEAAAWYWHFVDVVWLFLFFAVYIWGI